MSSFKKFCRTAIEAETPRKVCPCTLRGYEFWRSDAEGGKHIFKNKDGSREITEYTYRADGKVIKEKKGAWEKFFKYDGAGRIAKVIQKKEGSEAGYESGFEYAYRGSEAVRWYGTGLIGGVCTGMTDGAGLRNKRMRPESGLRKSTVRQAD